MAKSMSQQLAAIAKKRRLSTEKFVKAAVVQAANVAVVKSPVGNPDLWVWNHPDLGYVDYVAWKGEPKDYTGGQFRSNWRLSLDATDFKIKDTTNYSAVMLDAKQELDNFKLGEDITFSNPMPYGPRLEYDAWSTQTPDGMVRPAVAALNKALNKGVDNA